MSPLRIFLLVVGVVTALAGLALSVGGAGALVFSNAHRGADGYLMTPAYEFATAGSAVTTPATDLRAAPDEWVPWTSRFNTRVTFTGAEGTEMFVGIGPADDVAAYLDGVAQSSLEDLGNDPDDVVLQTVEGSVTPAPPAEQSFWVASAQGTGTQTMNWKPGAGRWTAVMMNADGSAGVSVAAAGGVETRLLWPIGIGIVVAGLLLLVLGAVLIIFATSGNRAGMHRPMGEAVAPTPAGAGLYPVTIEGYLDEPLSRGLWLVKWLLAIPHYLVLAVLWVAFFVLTPIAGVAILFTGRYPRSIFEFNVGVLRWSWRVSYYGYSALGTDRYPPFTLAAADYPASFDVAYPQRLSRGLVLVKWWLLAIPHYIVLGLLIGGASSWAFGDRAGDNWQIGASGGVIGVLAVVAGIVILATSRYPRGLFDVMIGLNRWVYRVIAYAALMTDEYPPFRLDTGGSEPQPEPSGPLVPQGGMAADRQPVRQ